MGAFFLAENFEKVSSDPYNFRITRLLARKSEQVIRGPTLFGKALNLIFPKLSSQNMRGFDHATILSPSFHGLRKEQIPCSNIFRP